MVMIITKILTKSLTTPIAPLAKTSPNASTSLVKRVTKRPTGERSKKLEEREVTWVNKSSRTLAVID